jgi:hypothetical protein
LQPKNVLEIGFFEGGTSIFLAEVANPERIVSLDFRDVPEGLAYGQPIDTKSLTRSRGNHLTLI